jgi:tRNA modification GTPase
MDLSQAEAVADLIASSSAATHRLAMNQMRGGFSEELRNLRDKLLHLTSLMELELDFSEEDVEFADRSEMLSLFGSIDSTLSHLLDSFKVGNALKNGVPVAIIGETNVGKSTLLNQLLHEDKAIVSDIHGTTRDTIEDTIMIDGTLFRFIDTAGIRETNDSIEHIGIERTFKKIDDAQIVLWLIDATNLSNTFTNIRDRLLPHIADKSLIVVVNKCDLVDETDLYTAFNDVYEHSGINPDETIFISAKTGNNISALESKLNDYTLQNQYGKSDVIVTNLRHAEALRQALDSLRRANETMKDGISTDLVAEDLRLCLNSLGEIVGEVTNDEVMGNIFSHFCVGK